MPVPDLGFEVKHLFKIGTTLAYNVGVGTKVLTSATIVFGATASLPDDALITVDLLNTSNTAWSGFENGALDPIFDLPAFSGSLKVAVFTQADIAFGLEMHNVAKFDIELNLKIPQISIAAIAGYGKYLHHQLSTPKGLR